VLIKLRNVLQCYTRRNLSIGYVQGFNFIVGRLLKITLNEEDCFWLFCQIIENILPLNFYSEMAGLMIDTDILMCLLNSYFSDLMFYLEENFFIEYFKNILLQWFISLFIQNFNFNTSIALWDILFIEGSIVLFKTVIGLIKLVKNDIMKITSLETFKNFLKNYFSNYKDISHLNHILLLRKFEFSQETITSNRILLSSYIINHINELNKYKIKKLKENIEKINSECLEMWPICIYDSESNYKVIEHFVIRGISEPVCYDDYLDDRYLKLKKLKKKFYVDFDSALIERKFHCCGKMLKRRVPVTPEFTLETDDSNNMSTDDTKSNRSGVDISSSEVNTSIQQDSKDNSLIFYNNNSNVSSGTKSIY
jgi:hypothetical protein